MRLRQAPRNAPALSDPPSTLVLTGGSRVADGSIVHPQLTQYAEQIAAGGSFNITADKLS